MSSTAECVKAIVESYPDTQASQWKRRHKQETRYDHEVARVFENVQSGAFCTVYSLDGRNVVKDGNLLPKTDPAIMKALVDAANSIVHCGDGMTFFWNPTTKTAWMTMADSDCPSEEEEQEPGFELTTGEEVVRRMKKAGAERVLLVAEHYPFWEDISIHDEDEDDEDDDEMSKAQWWKFFPVKGVNGIEAPSKW